MFLFLWFLLIWQSPDPRHWYPTCFLHTYTLISIIYLSDQVWIIYPCLCLFKPFILVCPQKWQWSNSRRYLQRFAVNCKSGIALSWIEGHFKLRLQSLYVRHIGRRLLGSNGPMNMTFSSCLMDVRYFP